MTNETVEASDGRKHSYLIAMLNVSTKRPLSDPDSAQDSKKIGRCEIGLE